MSKHPAPADQPADLPDDLERNPGIGQSAGGERSTFAELEGDNTIEGDVENDVGPNGEVDPDQRGRANA
jgi:hypothetical protein